MTGKKWWHPASHAGRRPFLIQRSRIRARLVAWFANEGFTEVECGALQVSPGNETHLHAFATRFVTDDGHETPLYLHTSPEFSCKKLLAAGEGRIVDFSRVFRNRETGPLHSPEFTMIEWYRAGASLDDVMQDAAALCRTASETTGRTVFVWNGRECDPALPPERLTLTDAFGRHAGIDLEAVLDDAEGLRQAARNAGVGVADDASWSDIFSAILVTRIEPELGNGRLTLLYNYPLTEAALARACPGDPRFAERFELYACGVELANGFHELTDADEQRARFEADMALKEALYGERYPIDEDFLAALEAMPDASGVALGFDRLAMLATGARSVHDVQWTPVDL
ncbi:MAG: EF-P lysine aminoacylase GenX [Rhodobiaceae bacterium]|nr:EF-P lysine aminoacylase GenX [Hyphomonas sp.]MCB9971187.1 EF-P lysine aminoacylase GenX [Hyphomonas sp.]MCC0050256.1 EF-P lysine aminoacylase GenX [Rhodobiaceae bacterium]